KVDDIARPSGLHQPVGRSVGIHRSQHVDMEQLVEQIRRDFVRWAVLLYPGDICQYIKASHGLSCCLKRLVYLIRVTDIAVVIAHMTTWKMFCQFFNEPLSLYVID